MTRLERSIGTIVILAATGAALSSACGSSTIVTVPDNVAGSGGGGAAGSAGAGGVSTGTGGTGEDASTGTAGSSIDEDASINVGDSMVVNPDGAIMLGDSSLEDDGGNDIVEDAGAIADGGADAGKTFTIRCGYVTGTKILRSCAGPTRKCCYDSDAPTAVCAATTMVCATGNGTYSCDGPEDCNPGQVCCARVSTLKPPVGMANEFSTSCSSSCGKGFVQRDTAYSVACKTAADCATGQSCAVVTNMAPGIGACVSRVLLPL